MAYKQTWFGRPKKPEPTIDDLAFRFLEGRYPLGRMKEAFGRKKTNDAVTRMANINLMCDPEHGKSQEWMKRMGR